ncbi:LAFE_0E02982g1_1 [Lachancea fermentati]|uniref:LAFE_0E02982g1_1 n=1 Tax=Lachancea fermentati TaxID=4955 RepID=A0A1G4MCH3_LACFM|nr:LAFE_0E02982g1_1 [Lachancea fermentati]
MLDPDISVRQMEDMPPPVRLSRSWNTTTVNQLLGLPGMFSTFTAPELKKLRIIAITASVASVVAAIVGLYYFAGIDKRRKVFRHYLIFFLIFCDFLKALILMIYPIIILIRNDIYGIPAFYNTLGWLTAFAVEGADFAIAVFAVHFALLIFVPTWKWLNPKTGNMEGGLYPLRHFLYAATFLLPAIMASLAFVNFTKDIPINENDNVVLDNNNFGFAYQARVGGYKAFSAWCYLPPRPYWYRLVLSWGPRYFIIVLIFSIYLSIYIYVSKESRKIKVQIGDFRHDRNGVDLDASADNKKLLNFKQKLLIHLKMGSRKIGITKVYQSLKSFFFLSFEDDSEDSTDSNEEDDSTDNPYSFSLDSIDYDDGFQSDDFRNGVQSFNYDPEELSRALREREIAANADREDESLGRNKRIQNLIKQNFNKSFRRHSLASKDAYSNKSTRGAPSSASLRAKSNTTDSLHNFLSGDNGSSVFYSPSNDTSNSNKKSKARRSSSKKRRKNSVSKAGGGTRSRKPTESSDQAPECAPILSPVRSINPISGSIRNTINSEQAPKSDHTRASNADQDACAVHPDHILDLKHNFQFETYQEFKKRRSQIRRQLRSIFIYPFSYIVIWTFPIVVDIIQYHYEIIHGPVVWLEYIATFMQPLSCVVDVSVFLYREKPWRHSWDIIVTKDLMSRYSLKGEIGESEILHMCNSKEGKRGWYYRGKWMKMECWRHQPQRWKRIAWFIYRAIKGFMKNDYDYEDNCNDAEYWESYYSGNTPISPRSRSTQYTQGTQAFKDIINVSNRKQSSFSASTTDNYSEIEGYVKVPMIWRIIHFLPMWGGIDLDALDRHIRLKSREDPFEIPGLQFALTKGKPGQEKENTSFFKADYSLSSTPAKKPSGRQPSNLSTRGSSSSSQTNHSPHNSTANLGPITSKFSFSANMDFKDVTSSKLPGITHEIPRSKGDEMDIMDFLNG